MLIKIYDYRIVASEVQYFYWQEIDSSSGLSVNNNRLLIAIKDNENYLCIPGPKTLLDEFEKQYNEIMEDEI